jgi:hypothetical protein
LPPAHAPYGLNLRRSADIPLLYGGTAVALYLGHRESMDFDFFTNRAFQPDELFADYRFLRDSEVFQSQPNTLTVLTAGHDTDRVQVRPKTSGRFPPQCSIRPH